MGKDTIGSHYIVFWKNGLLLSSGSRRHITAILGKIAADEIPTDYLPTVLFFSQIWFVGETFYYR
jgi:hypothetical protein